MWQLEADLEIDEAEGNALKFSLEMVYQMGFSQ